jgi:hypothetical protein
MATVYRTTEIGCKSDRLRFALWPDHSHLRLRDAAYLVLPTVAVHIPPRGHDVHAIVVFKRRDHVQ